MDLDESTRLVNFKQNPLYTSSSFKTSISDAEISSSPTKRLIYCVHGKPSGSCVVTEGEVIDKSASYKTYASLPPTDRHDSSATIIGEHCHRYVANQKENSMARRKLILASILCVLFMIGEAVGGVLSSSLAIATDAAHLLTDFASFMISLFSLWMANRPATRQMSFGWYRAEVIGALTSVLLIWVVTGVLVYLAVLRVINRDFEINAFVMLVTSGVGVAVNLVMGLTLHQHGHSHAGSHTHNMEDSIEGDKKEHENINVRAAFIHVLGDFIQSVGVLVAAIIIYFKPEWNLVDPICTFLFSVLVLITTFAIIRDTLMVLMEGLPKGIDFNEVLETFLQIDGVIKVHNLRIWALSLDKTALSAHLAIRPGASPHKILRQASRKIHAKFNFLEMTLQIEEFNTKMDDCLHCKCPES